MMMATAPSLVLAVRRGFTRALTPAIRSAVRHRSREKAVSQSVNRVILEHKPCPCKVAGASWPPSQRDVTVNPQGGSLP